MEINIEKCFNKKILRDIHLKITDRNLQTYKKIVRARFALQNPSKKGQRPKELKTMNL